MNALTIPGRSLELSVQQRAEFRRRDVAGPGGVTILGGRGRIGGTAPRDAIRDPMYNQVVIDVEGFQVLPDRCLTR